MKKREKHRSGLRRRYQPCDKRPDRRRFVLTGSSREAVRPFKSIGSFDTHLPALSCARSGDRKTPIALPITERVFDVRGDLSAQLDIAKILKLDRDSHPVTILSKTHCPLAVQTGQDQAGWPLSSIMNNLIHNSC